MKRLKRKKVIAIVILLCIFLSLILFQFTRSVKLDNDVEVQPNSELTYYLEVHYDGVDKYGVESDDTTIARVYSDYIYVEDRLPEGLTFERFLISSIGVIGAVRRDDENVACSGSIVDDTGNANEMDSEITLHGLHYNKDTRKVTFKVTGMQAGCKLVVGIVTRTPSIRSGERIDFYNNATAREDWQVITSNTVHAYMGGDITRYKVLYEYSGDVPENAPVLPTNLEYAKDVNINVLNEPLIEGYKFSGWKTSDVEVTDGVFTMPEKQVKFTGTFEVLPKYKVTYTIAEKPEGYVEPLEKEYYPNAIVNLDSLSKGDIFNGYEFLGWTVEGVEIDRNTFMMPERDVTITGRFNVKKYKVEYKFIGDVLPDNSDSLLPITKEYAPNEKVTLDKVTDVVGYHFLGWQVEDNFEMPKEDIVIYGSWIRQNGSFEPEIKMEIINPREYYKKGDKIKYKITVTNTASYSIQDVTLFENNSKAKFTSGSGYTIDTDRIVTIGSISAGGSVVVQAEYVVLDSDSGSVTNEIELISAHADNYYNLNSDKTYKAAVTVNLYAKLDVCNTIDRVTNSTYQYHVTTDDGYDTWVSVGANDCAKIYLGYGNYKVTELIPQDNIVDSETKEVSVTKDSEVTFINTYKKKGFYKSNGDVENLVESKVLYYKIKQDAMAGLNNTQILSADQSGVDEEIYYYTNANNNNVIFANFCWKIVRTTETGGVKLLYNGRPNNGICNNTGNNTQIGTSLYNPKYNYFSYVGYMYNTNYSFDFKIREGTASSNETKILNAGVLFGTDLIYENGVYTLQNPIAYNKYLHTGNLVNGRHYTCFTKNATCSTVYYVFYWFNDPAWFISLRNGQNVQDATDLMFGADDNTEDSMSANLKGNSNYVNKYNSTIKTSVDNWYRSNMTKYTNYLEDTIWCNHRDNYGGFHEESRGDAKIYFGSQNVNKLLCPRRIDSFTVSEEKGNGDLIYPIGLLTSYENSLAGWSIYSGNAFWLMSPSSAVFSSSSTSSSKMESNIYVSYSGGTSKLLDGNSYGVRPAISLKPEMKYFEGNGTISSPYIIVED